MSGEQEPPEAEFLGAVGDADRATLRSRLVEALDLALCLGTVEGDHREREGRHCCELLA